jgi:Flp pilus assembly secretin CpaC
MTALMLHRLRCAPLLLLALGLTACGLTEDETPAPPPAPPISTSQPAPPPGNTARLEKLKADLARAHAGEEPVPAQPVVPPQGAQPAQPAQPEQPAQPAQPEQPAQPAQPAPTPAVQPPPPAPVQAVPRSPELDKLISPSELSALLQASREHAAAGSPGTGSLVAAFVQQGLQAAARGDMIAAHQRFADALALDPADPAARELATRSTTLAAAAAASAAAAAAAAPQEGAAGVSSQTLMLVDEHTRLGDEAMSNDDPETALKHYQDALTLLRTHPELTRGNTLEAAMSARVAVARTAVADRQSLELQHLTMQASAQQQQLDEEAVERQADRIELLMKNANRAFLAGQYAEAEATLDELLATDPNNEEAANLKRIAQRARHEARSTAAREAYRNEWQDTFDELEHDLVPQTETVVFPEQDDWERIEQRGQRALGRDAVGSSPIDQAVIDRLAKRIPVNFQDEPLDQVLAHLSAVSGVNILQSQAVQDLGLTDTYSLEDRFDQPISRILTIILEDLTVPPLSYTVRDGVVLVITKDEARSDYVLQMYDIRDLTFTPKDYAAKDFNLLPSGTDADSYAAPADEEATPFIGPDALVTLIQDNISAESWTSDPNRTIQLMPGTLVVRQTSDVHDQITQLLDDLRANTKTLIHIETRFIEVEDSFLEDIGVDLRGLPGELSGNFPMEDFGQSGAGGFGLPGNPEGIGTGNEPGFFYAGDNGDIKGRIENLFDFTLGEPDTLNNAGGLSLQALFLDDTNVSLVLRAVAKYQTSNIVNAPNLMLRSGQRGNVKGKTVRTYLRDFEPEIAQAAVIAQPELANLEDGVLLDVRAVASADRRFVTLELRPTVIDLVPDENGNALPQETVSLGTTNSSEVTIELPELRIQRLRTTATIPDGATLMLGGLKRSVEQNQKSGVPFLSDIPILGAAFSRQGEYTSKRKLIILMKASIVVPEEQEPSPLLAR